MTTNKTTPTKLEFSFDFEKKELQFGDGKIWDIDVGKSKLKDSPEAVEKSLSDLFAEYENAIKHIDFRLDTQKIKHDIQKRTASFLKKRR